MNWSVYKKVPLSRMAIYKALGGGHTHIFAKPLTEVLHEKKEVIPHDCRK